MNSEKLTGMYINLQLFAKEGPGGEKTEEPTAKKLSDARKDGNVAKSKDIVTAFALMTFFIMLKFFIGSIGEGFLKIFSSVYSRITMFANPYANEITYNSTIALMKGMALDSLGFIWPLFAAGFLITVLGYMLQVKLLFTTKPLKPKFNKMSPAKGIKRMFSKQSIVNLIKSLALVIIIMYVVYGTIIDKLGFWYKWYDVSLMTALSTIGDIVITLGLKISAIYLIVGIGDYFWSKHKYHEDMKMTKQEVKDEYKNSEGDPKVKAQQRRVMQKTSMRRMMQSVPDADVVITNPTHFAVALKYDLDVAKAPIVVAKGADYIAQKIKEKAREANVEIVENRPLARALYANVEINSEIPEELYQAVAEVLAFVYNIKNKTQ